MNYAPNGCDHQGRQITREQAEAEDYREPMTLLDAWIRVLMFAASAWVVGALLYAAWLWATTR